eukprot:5890528-Amphidinium_carterae.1
MLDKQSALHLIRQCLASCKLAYAMRVVPPGFHLSALQEFDQVVRQALEGLLDGDLPDYAWAQAGYLRLDATKTALREVLPGGLAVDLDTAVPD